MSSRRLSAGLSIAGILVLLAGLLLFIAGSNSDKGAAALASGFGFALICLGQAVRKL
ncbi:tetrahydromethanopterin S-methyltransferase subunit F [Streptacidiphilus sp. MAP12-20]